MNEIHKNELSDDMLDAVAGGTSEGTVEFMGQVWNVGDQVKLVQFYGGCNQCGDVTPCPVGTIVDLWGGCMASAKVRLNCCGGHEYTNLDRLAHV